MMHDITVKWRPLQGLAICMVITASLVALCPGRLQAHESSLEVWAANGRLSTNARLYSEALGVPNDGVVISTTPSIAAISGMDVGQTVQMHVLGPLEFATGDASIPTNESTALLEIRNPADDQMVAVNAESAGPASLDWLAVTELPMDHHGWFTFHRGDDPDGVYGIRVQLSSAGYASSNPFLILFKTHDFDSALFSPAAYQILTSLPGDANLDGRVDEHDLAIWSAHRFQPFTDWFRGDFNLDGSTDVADFNVWLSHRTGGAGAAAAVPEPSGWEAVASGFLLLAAGGRRRVAHVAQPVSGWCVSRSKPQTGRLCKSARSRVKEG